MEGQQAYYSLIAFGVAILLGIAVLIFSILFERRMRMHSKQNIVNILTNPCKVELEKLRKDIEDLKLNKLSKVEMHKTSNDGK